MLGAAEAVREAINTPQSLADQGQYRASLTAVRQHLSPEALATAWDEGRAMMPEAAAAFALNDARAPLRS